MAGVRGIRVRGTAALVLCAAALGAVWAAPAVAGPALAPCGLSGVATPSVYAHVVVIMEENTAYAKVVGSPNAPVFNQLANQCALATNYNDDAGVSQPNYMAATSGYASGVGVHVNAPSIFSQVSSWLELEESMASRCGGTSPFYKRGHDPAFWYTPLASACKQFDQPVAATDAGTIPLPSTLPAYTFITPNLCHDDHYQTGCSEPNTTAAKLKAMDTWLGGVIGELTQTPDYLSGQTLILVTFDESSTSTSKKVATVAIAGGVQATTDKTSYDHYALLRASEEALGISTFLGNAAGANDMRPGMGF